jgi:membrane protein
MVQERRPNRLMRLVQQAVDLAAVAQARYGQRLQQASQGIGRRRPSAVQLSSSQAALTGTPDASLVGAQTRGDISSSPSEAGGSPGSDGHSESRTQIGDALARPAPPGPNSPPEPCRDHLLPTGAWPTVKELFRRFGKDQCGAYAAALTFFSILSIIPALVVALAAMASLFPDPGEAMRQLQKLIANILPGAFAGKAAASIMQEANVQKSVETLIRTRGIAGVIGLLSLVWATMQIFVNGAPAMNAAFEVEEKRSWIKLRLVALGLLIGAGALFLLSLLPSTGPDFIRNLHWFALPEPVPWYIEGLFWLVALALNSAMFALVYKFLPNASSTWREALVGGMAAGVLWEVAKQGFSYYIAHFGNYNKVYGVLGGTIVLLLWMYYTSMIMLLGAEVTSLYRDLREGAAQGDQPEAARASAPAPSHTRARA